MEFVVSNLYIFIILLCQIFNTKVTLLFSAKFSPSRPCLTDDCLEELSAGCCTKVSLCVDLEKCIHVNV